MARRTPLFALIKAVGVTALMVVAVLAATAITAQAGRSKELTTVVIVAGFMLAASLAAVATMDG
jgi:hypothetical protein